VLSPTATRQPIRQFLRFSLEPDTEALLPVSQLSEVLTVPLGQIVPIPHLPPWAMGVYNWRGEILWVADLGYLLGLTPWRRQAASRSNYPVIILNGSGGEGKRPTLDRNQVLGLVVSQVKDIESTPTDQIQSVPPASVGAGLIPYLRGLWISPENEVFVVLEGRAILEQVKQSRGF
jgi:positive phototaxis protein PixI